MAAMHHGARQHPQRELHTAQEGIRRHVKVWIQNLLQKALVFRGRVFGRWLDHTSVCLELQSLALSAQWGGGPGWKSRSLGAYGPGPPFPPWLWLPGLRLTPSPPPCPPAIQCLPCSWPAMTWKLNSPRKENKQMLELQRIKVRINLLSQKLWRRKKKLMLLLDPGASDYQSYGHMYDQCLGKTEKNIKLQDLVHL